MNAPRKETPPRFELTGGDLAVDFANTLADRPTAPREGLRSYRDLVRFQQQAEVLSPSAARTLNHAAATRQKKAGDVLRAARALREALHQVFSALADRKNPPERALRVLNAALRRTAERSELTWSRRGFQWRLPTTQHELEQVLWPVAQAASRLLTSDRLQQIRACESETCGWLFLDQSKNHSRRWCDMKICGNRTKARRFYKRTRG